MAQYKLSENDELMKLAGVRNQSMGRLMVWEVIPPEKMDARLYELRDRLVRRSLGERV